MAAKKKYFISARGNDLAKQWFVYFYDDNGKRVRKYGTINQETTVEGRMAAARALIADMEGAVPPRPLALRMSAYLQNRKSEWRQKTFQTYTSKFDTFMLWLGPRQITKETIGGFLAEVARTRHAATYNWYISFFKTLLKKLNELDLMPAVQPKRANSSPASYFQRHQVQRLKAYLIHNDPELWRFCQFVYYCFIRPGELRLLKVEDVLLDEWKIRVPAAVSKNRKVQVVTIPVAFRCDLEGLGERTPGEYLFHQPGSPGVPYSMNRMNKRHRKVLTALGFSTAHKLYSWKHTGAINAVLAGVTVKELQIQLRHASLEEVDKYLRQLGAFDLKALEDKFPGI